ncbi:polysaccharide deacetylase family protein [Deinococcus marmoris]|uniref:Polysaccharide deacetylase n=1 Tax=Deinococcus marmoris TaxID=249408 RepID=A0A1U7NY30_9DEIO|nr:polysaccharide deacetylase family protein [Deinococcus marmoris]OLV17829.1 polysaccharide deacetylase [Deinococcus marmoris]
MKRTLPLWTAALVSFAAGQGLSPLPAPKITAAGEVQLVAPGQRPSPVIPTLKLTPPIPQVKTVEVMNNSFTRAAHALVLVSAQEAQGSLVALATQVTTATYRADPGLAEVDVSIYRAGDYGGFGGPLPLLTLSVPVGRRTTFANELKAGSYDRAWVGAKTAAPAPKLTPLDELERLPVFAGTRAELLAEQLEQALGLVRGGVRGGKLFRGSPLKRQVALTFDDVPHPMYFPLLLDLLRREKAHATFFIIGRNAEAYPYFVLDLVAQGHEVANHTFHHLRLPGLSAAEVTAELKTTNELITSISGQPVQYFRPPGGDYSAQTLKIAEKLGLTTVFWTDDPGDFQNPGVETVEARFARRLRPGGIILLHDNAPDGLMALPDLLRVARQRGYVVDTVGHLPR